MIERIKNFITKVRFLPSSDEALRKSHQRDCAIFFILFIFTTSISVVFRGIVQNPDLNITMFYILGNFLVARYTLPCWNTESFSDSSFTYRLIVSVNSSLTSLVKALFLNHSSFFVKI